MSGVSDISEGFFKALVDKLILEPIKLLFNRRNKNKEEKIKWNWFFRNKKRKLIRNNKEIIISIKLKLGKLYPKKFAKIKNYRDIKKNDKIILDEEEYFLELISTSENVAVYELVLPIKSVELNMTPAWSK